MTVWTGLKKTWAMPYLSEHISSLLLLAALPLTVSCSIKENRKDCPCYLDVYLERQADVNFSEGKAWCSVWMDDKLIASDEMPVPDDSLEFRIHPRDVVTAIVSSSPSTIAAKGQQMPALHIARRDVDCNRECASLTFETLDKRYCLLSLTLSEEALEFRDRISIELSSPYNGIDIPSLKASRGSFSFVTSPDKEGRASAVIPPQAGPGLQLTIRLDDRCSSTTDLYALMKESLYNWDGRNLADFSCVISLNGVSQAFEISDWDLVDIEEKIFQ